MSSIVYTSSITKISHSLKTHHDSLFSPLHNPADSNFSLEFFPSTFHVSMTFARAKEESVGYVLRDHSFSNLPSEHSNESETS